MIAITGSHGFVGKGFITFASKKNIDVRLIARENYLAVKSYEGCDVVIHLAGLAHRKSATLKDFIEINCDLAVNCARTAARAGVKRFIYVSSSKALRDFAENDQPLKESERASPRCDYGRSKLAAETALLGLHREGHIEVVVIRPALVIGAPAKANLRTLARAAHWACRLSPINGVANWVFSGFQAQKSYTSLENLCSALVCSAHSKLASGGVFHVVEDQTMSTAFLFNRMVAAGRTNLGLPRNTTSLNGSQTPTILTFVLRQVLTFLGMIQVFQALALPFVLDGTKIQKELDWKPQAHIDAELQRIMANLPSLDERSKG